MAIRKLILLLVKFLLFLRLGLSKECKYLGPCRCEMTDGSGIIDLTKLDNKDGDPRFKNIPNHPSIGSTKYYSFNPCTVIKKMPGCESNLCQYDSSTGENLACGLPDPAFTVDEKQEVVMNFKSNKLSNSAKITLVCDNSVEGSFGDGISFSSESGETIFSGTLTAKYACAFPVPSSELSAGSILLIVFFSVLVLYFVIGIIINVKFKHKESVPEVFPNHEFWADCPFLVKDGCVFSFSKLKSCCCFLFAKARGNDNYSSI